MMVWAGSPLSESTPTLPQEATATEDVSDTLWESDLLQADDLVSQGPGTQCLPVVHSGISQDPL